MAIKKSKAKAGEDDDLDALLAEFEPAAGVAEAVKREDAVEAAPEAEAAPGAEEGGGQSAAALKKKLKKKAALEKKRLEGAKNVAAAGDEPQPAAAADGEVAPAPKKEAAKKPLSAAAKAAAERLRKLKEFEEKQREEQEKYRAIEEAEIKRELEEQTRLNQEAEARRQWKAEKKKKLAAEGKLLSARDRAARAKNQQYVEQLRAQGLLPEAEEIAPAADQEGLGKATKSKLVDDRRRRKHKKEPTGQIPDTEADAKPTEQIPGALTSNPVSDDSSDDLSDWEEALLDEQEGKKKKEKEEKEEKVGASKAPGRSRRGPQIVSDLTSVGGSSTLNPSGRPSSSSAAASLGSDCVPHSSPKTATADGPRLRSPICCILGHVDTGKTKLLDKIRHTDVQDSEAGGITQQIGATFFPHDTLASQCFRVDPALLVSVPGLLIIDTPGHESFNNLRSRGSSLCDIAILVIDIMHGLEPQTRESLGLLKARKCPFVIALNKTDRLYNWKSEEWMPFTKSLALQEESVRNEFEKRYNETLVQLSEEGFNCNLYWLNSDIRGTVSIAPTSAITGEGIPDLLMLLVKLTQDVMTHSITFQERFQCTILEVKAIDGLGTTIDVVLVNGSLCEGDRIVICGMRGPIVTTIRALLTPQPLKELRVKGDYIHHQSLTAAIGVKISAPVFH
eukprot:GHVT01029483.1.p1 GENE.GHVT01029483.1~~GHVT01029483.1.p1  ORF type:complete len:676 (+),score=183.27 GHVT01029483.1:1469-3496(+)